MGPPFDWPTGLFVDATHSRKAEGLGFRLVYNPMDNRTMKFTEGRRKGFAFGGGARWEDEASMGNYGIMRPADAFRPIYGDEEFHIDLWASYTMPIGNDKNLKVQLNIRDALEDGGLQKVAADYDGSACGYRYIDPRQFFLTTALEF